jgi:polyphosphate:AMP phosphotransferase
MFESAEIGSRIEKAEYKREEPKIRTALLAAQRRLGEAPLSVVVLIGGVEGAGKAETVNLLLAWMDPRGIRVHALWEDSDEERERPPMWRFWRRLPPKRKMGVFFGSWYSMPIVDRVFGRIDDGEFDQAIDRIVEFERMLDQEDTLVVKLWLHLARKTQKKRLRKLEKDPKQRWRVTEMDWKFFKKYEKFQRVSEHALRRTSTARAPWHVIEASDVRYRNLTVARSLLAALEQRLAEIAQRKAPKPAPDRPRPKAINIINQLDLDKALPDEAYERKLLKWQAKINQLSRRLYEEKKSLILVFEGPDAAGKGGAIRRVLSAVDARNYAVIPVAAPTDEEHDRPYLWRFWRHLPRQGRVTVFDRSWYGRVLVERIEGFCSREDWQRAYAEINAFEEQMTDSGIVLVKFWLAVSPDVQLQRFKERETTPYKQYKLTEEDWRNRDKWNAYLAAACEMIERTSVENAPWVLVEANDKNYARIKVMKTVAKALKRAIG